MAHEGLVMINLFWQIRSMTKWNILGYPDVKFKNNN